MCKPAHSDTDRNAIPDSKQKSLPNFRDQMSLYGFSVTYFHPKPHKEFIFLICLKG